MSHDDKPKTARSYRGSIVDDNAVISINIKWLIQLACAIVALVLGYYRIETRIRDLERGMVESNEQIEDLISKHIAEEEIALGQLQEELQWYQQELNLNPLSWKFRKK